MSGRSSCAAGLDFDGFLVTPRCADPLYRRSVRVSMGTVFDLPWTQIDPWPDSLNHLRDNGFVVVGVTPTTQRSRSRRLRCARSCRTGSGHRGRWADHSRARRVRGVGSDSDAHRCRFSQCRRRGCDRVLGASTQIVDPDSRPRSHEKTSQRNKKTRPTRKSLADASCYRPFGIEIGATG